MTLRGALPSRAFRTASCARVTASTSSLEELLATEISPFFLSVDLNRKRNGIFYQ